MAIGKRIILTALLLSLSVCTCSAGSNDLLKMDVKKSSLQDAVDVTFYTTGGATNSVVTRKSDNRYVVLLPNVAGSPSAAPNIGGVKDLITHIDVKNVNDGIGGYTKVTFTTSKPVKIQTSMKKTAPLTKAQEEYKTLIAQNKNTKPAPQAKKAVPAAAKAPAPVNKKTTATASKPQEQKQQEKNKNVKNNNVITALKDKVKPAAPKNDSKPAVQTKPKIAQNSTKKISGATPAPVQGAKPKTTPEPAATAPKPAPVQTQKTTTAAVNNNTAGQKINNINDQTQSPVSKHSLLEIILIGIGGLIALQCLGKLLFGRKEKPIKKHFQDNQTFSNITNREELNDIANDKNLSWQEKYNLYNQSNGKQAASDNSALSYVTDFSGNKKAIKEHKPSAYKVNEITEVPAELDSIPEIRGRSFSGKIKEAGKKKLSFKNSSENKAEEVLKEELRARISSMEHALSQTPGMSSVNEPKKELYSEEDTITDNMSKIKLKSFAKPVLNSTHRMLLGAEMKPAEELKEGKFVKLKNSPLNISTRKSASSEINGSGYYKNYGEMNMNKNDNYSVSSLNEYFSILDSEEKTPMKISRPVKTKVVSGMVSNPIAPSYAKEDAGLPGNMIIKSSYNIDSQRGFYLVDMNGKSALIGKINDNIFMLKNFDTIINQKLQVRLDSSNEYMVKAGRYKFMVDVSKDKMGTLIEI